MDSRYYTAEAIQAQEDYCERRGLPRYAPSDGTCYHCMQNIYAPVKGLYDGLGGYTVEYAASHLITSCPHCRHSFVD